MSSALLGTQCASQSVGTFNTMVSALIQSLLAAQCAISPPELWPQDYADQALKYGLDTYDFVVVGAGSAGSVIASRLSENPNWKILVLEAGVNPPQESEIPTLSSGLRHTNWNYLTEYSDKACLSFADSRCYWTRGKMIGGSGGANSMLYVRGNPRDYDSWAESGKKSGLSTDYSWGWDDVLPYFERSVWPVGDDKHPQGYVVLNNFPIINKNLENMLYQGAAELGVPYVSQIAEGSYIGYTSLPATFKDGRRMSTGKTYLGKVAQRPNLHVIKDAIVTKLNFNKRGKSVISVDFVLREKYKMTVNITKELVLSAGAIESAKLLMLSGVGPSQHLKHLQVPLVHDLPIGENMKDHLEIVTFVQLNKNTARPITYQDSMDSTYNYLLHRNGTLSTNDIFSIVGFVNTLNDGPYPDVQFQHVLFRRGDFSGFLKFYDTPSLKQEISAQILEVLEVSDLLVVFSELLNPNSIGKLRLHSSNYSVPPKITHNYLNEPEDAATLLRAVRFQERLLKTAAYERLNATLVLPKIYDCDTHVSRSDNYWRCYFKYFTSTVYHTTSTVKMAPETDPTSCVNPRLRLVGTENVRVADASIMPNVPSANTNAATIMIAEKATDFMREDWQGHD